MRPFTRQLEAAGGWLLLGNAQEAARELDAIDEVHRLHFDVLVLRARVCRHLEDWTQLAIVADQLCEVRPRDPQWMLCQAMATRHLHGAERAICILMDAVEVFPDEAAAFYDLACCEALCGNVDLARGWLNEAYRLAPELGKVARVDVDLASLHGDR